MQSELDHIASIRIEDFEGMIEQNSEEVTRIKETLNGLISGIGGLVHKDELASYATH